MATNNLPKLQGDPVYAAQDGVYVYESADINSAKMGNFLTGGDSQFNKFDLIGSYNGEQNGSFYQVTTTVWVRVFPLLPKQKKTINGWVLGNQITTNSKEDVTKTEEQKKDDDLQNYLDTLTGGDEATKKSLTGSSSGEASVDKNNVIIGSVIVVTIILIIVGVVRKFRKKAPVINQPLKS